MDLMEFTLYWEMQPKAIQSQIVKGIEWTKKFGFTPEKEGDIVEIEMTLISQEKGRDKEAAVLKAGSAGVDCIRSCWQGETQRQPGPCAKFCL